MKKKTKAKLRELQHRIEALEAQQPPLVTKSGHVMTDDEIRKLSKEAEEGYDPAKIQPIKLKDKA